MMNLLQILLHLLDYGFRMEVVLYHKVNIHYDVVEAHQGFCEGRYWARERVYKSRHKHWNNHVPKWFQLLTTAMGHLAKSHVQLNKAMICGHYCPERVAFANSGRLFEKAHYPVHQMLMHSEIDSVRNMGYDSSQKGDEFHIL